MRFRLTSVSYLNLALAAIVFGLVLILFPNNKKYTIQQIEKNHFYQNAFYTYETLSPGQPSVRFRFDTNFMGYTSFLMDDGIKTPFQWNLKGKVIEVPAFYHCGDIDGDQFKEIFIFTHRGDSLFLNLYDIKNETELFSEKFITTFKRVNGLLDGFISDVRITDLNKNGKNELLFVLNCAFSYVTRQLYLWEFGTDTIIASPVAGTTITNNLTIEDIDNDGKQEIMGELSSHGNSQQTYPYSDQYTWFQFYNSDLKFKIKPFIVGHDPARHTLMPWVINNKHYLLSYYYHQGTKDSSYIALYSTTGKLFRKRNIDFTNGYIVKANRYPNALLLIEKDGKVLKIDSNLVLTQIEQIPSFAYTLNMAIDINLDGEDERIFNTDDNEEFIIFSNDFSNAVTFENPGHTDPIFFSLEIKKGTPPIFVISSKGYETKYLYKKNSWYVFRWPIRLLLFLTIFAGFWLISLLHKKAIYKRINSERKIAALQIKSIRNQINPHFTLNILNTIGALYTSSNTLEADRALGRFAKMLRMAILSGDTIAVSLKEEINFIREYLELEKIRMNGHLNYKIEIASHVDHSVLIPKMILHTFVENALKHGIKQLPPDMAGHLWVIIMSHNNSLVISIDDNGIGRELAALNKTASTGQGLKILNEILSLYRQLENKSINYTISNTNVFERGTNVSVIIN